MQIKCFKCGYQWTPRTDKPKSCPECKARLKDKIIIIKEEEK
jgi:predicted Zn-ribbon and HTH transcriptional regulator